MVSVTRYRSPLGTMLLAADEVGLTGAWFEGQKYFAGTLTEGAREERSPVTDEAVMWLDLYFSGAVPDFLGGRLTGYAGGLERKRQLLRREQGLPFEPFNGGSPGSISAP